jgi:hypothetical protein
VDFTLFLNMLGEFCCFHFFLVLNCLNVMGGLIMVRLVEVSIRTKAHGAGVRSLLLTLLVELLVVFVLVFGTSGRIGGGLCGHL